MSNKSGTSHTKPQTSSDPHRPVTVTPTTDKGWTKTVSPTAQPGVTQPQPGKAR
jgi:hypothetical protein